MQMAGLDLEQLLGAPNLPQLLRQAELSLCDEAQRREEFYVWLREDVKAEFINGQIVMHPPVKEWHRATVGSISSPVKFLCHQTQNWAG